MNISPEVDFDEFVDVKKGLPPPLTLPEEHIDLLPQLSNILEKIPHNTPENFKLEAKKVAEWIQQLDGGNISLLLKPEIANWLAEISLKIPWAADASYLPWWLQSPVLAELQKTLFINPNLDPAREERLKSKFQLCGEKNQWSKQIIDNTTYFQFDTVGKTTSEADGFKIYLNAEFLESALDTGEFEKTINEINGTPLAPREMKYSDDGVVLYFRQEGQNPTELRNFFLKRNIKVSAPVQDVYRITDIDGDLQMTNFIFSNDSAATQWDIPLEAYNQALFFAELINFGLKTGKRLDKPNLTSFIYALTTEVNAQVNAQKLTRLPVCCSESVLTLIPGKDSNLK